MPQAYFIFGETKYFISKIFHSFRKERISLKKALANASAFFWLGNRDSNPNKQSQSLSCYRYTIPQNRQQDYYNRFCVLVKDFLQILHRRAYKSIYTRANSRSLSAFSLKSISKRPRISVVSESLPREFKNGIPSRELLLLCGAAFCRGFWARSSAFGRCSAWRLFGIFTKGGTGGIRCEPLS